MDINTAIIKLEAEWNMVELTGFFGNLKKGVFEPEGFQRVKDIFSQVDLSKSDAIDKRFVELTWFIPTFLHWQKEGWLLEDKDIQELDRSIEYFEQRLTTILGLP